MTLAAQKQNVSNGEGSADALPLWAELEPLLLVGYPDSQKQRQLLLKSWLRHEWARLGLAKDAVATAEQWDDVSARCRYFAAQEFLAWHVARQRAFSALLQEELLLYLQEHLLANDFRRLRQYEAGRGANLKTWLGSVLNNLTIDFARRRNTSLSVIATDLSVDESGHVASGGETVQTLADEASGADEAIGLEQLSGWMQLLFAEQDPAEPADGVRSRLAAELELSAKERLFLKLVYVSGLNPEEAGAKPGMGLGKNQAYSLQRRLLERIAGACKAAGVYEDLQDSVGSSSVSITVSLSGQTVKAELKQLRHFAKNNAQTSHCQLWWQERLQQGEVEQSFGRLHRRSYAGSSLIQSAEAVVDEHVLQVDKAAKQVEVRQLPDPLAVNARYIKNLHEQWQRDNSG